VIGREDGHAIVRLLVGFATVASGGFDRVSHENPFSPGVGSPAQRPQREQFPWLSPSAWKNTRFRPDAGCGTSNRTR
jgi:hypothetical protein